jgi:ATP-dependent helicase HrpB
MRTTQTLPIDSFTSDILNAVRDHPNVIVMAEPGAGKTTRVPVMVSTPSQKWIVLQPRRWAAKLTATRIADEQGLSQNWKLGDEVGYQIRFESKLSKKSQIVFMTEGVFLRRLVSDPELSEYAGIILDEFHERSLDLDVSLSLLKEIQASLRPDLKIIVMSATLDPTPISEFLGNCKTLSIPGRTFPVNRRYLGEVSIESAMRTVLTECSQNPKYSDGDLLVFLPGAFEIRRAVTTIQDLVQALGIFDVEVLPLYSSLSEADQNKVFGKNRSGNLRRVICSTNIAETSITLPNVKVVVDVGLAKVFRTDPQLGQDRLETLRISRASSEQRAGRAGRVSEGVCYRLWSEGEQNQLRAFEVPEIHRVHLGQSLMLLSEFGIRDFKNFNWYEVPRSSLLDFSLRELEKFQFLEKGALTQTGAEALKLPLSPQLANLVLVSRKMGEPAFGARLAAFLESKAGDDPVTDSSQLLRRLNQLDFNAQRVANQLYLAQGGNCPPVSNSWHLFEPIVLAALASRVFIDGKLVGRRTLSSRRAALPPVGLVLNSMEKTDRGVTFIEAQSFVEISDESLKKFSRKQTQTYWDEETKRVRALSGNFFEDLAIGNTTDTAVNARDAKPILVKEILRNVDDFFARFDEFTAWKARVGFFNGFRREGETKLFWDWEEVLDSMLDGKTKMDQVTGRDAIELIQSLWEYSLLQEFETWAPAKIEVPSGSSHAIDYSSPVPKLSVRLQEIFGWIDSPELALGRAKILIELLSPGFKPMQLTQDLKSFWGGAYFEVKKELKARYPKHSWPEDPLTAKPEAKGRRRF